MPTFCWPSSGFAKKVARRFLKNGRLAKKETDESTGPRNHPQSPIVGRQLANKLLLEKEGLTVIQKQHVLDFKS